MGRGRSFSPSVTEFDFPSIISMLYVLSITCYAFRASAPLIWIGEVNNRLQRSKGLTLDFFLFKKCIIRLCFEAPFGFLTSFRLLRETVFCFSGSAGHPTSPHPFFDFSCILYDNNLFLFTQRQCPVPQSPRRCSTSTSSSPQAGERWLRMIGLFRARRASAPGTYLLPLVPLGRFTLSVCASASNGRFSEPSLTALHAHIVGSFHRDFGHYHCHWLENYELRPGCHDARHSACLRE